MIDAGITPYDADRYITMQIINPQRDILGNIPQAGSSSAVLPSGSILRQEVDPRDVNHNIDTFFDAVVAPEIGRVRQRAQVRSRDAIAAERTEISPLVAFERNPLGVNIEEAVRAEAINRREQGPARIVSDVMGTIDAEKVNAYIAEHLKEDPEYAAVMEEVKEVIPTADDHNFSDEQIEQAVKTMTPAQRKQYDKTVDADRSVSKNYNNVLTRQPQPHGNVRLRNSKRASRSGLSMRWHVVTCHKTNSKLLLARCIVLRFPGLSWSGLWVRNFRRRIEECMRKSCNKPWRNMIPRY